MKTEKKSLDKCQVQLTVTIDAEEAKKTVKEVERRFVREARIPGFRPGKAPIELLRKQFAEEMRQEMERTMLREYYAAAVKEAQIEEVALAGVDKVTCGEGGGGFVATVEVKPQFKLPAYKGLKISEKDTRVADADVDARIAAMREAYAKYEDAKEGDALAEGDFAQIDYSGTVDNKPIAEIAPAATMVASGTGFWMQAKEGRFLPEIVEALAGMKAGETKEDVKVKFAKEGAPEGLGGKKAVYTVTLKAFRRRILPSDAELAEKTKSGSFGELAKSVREAMEKEAVEQEKTRRENEAVEMLLKKCDFDVPASQVRGAMDGYLGEFAKRAQYSGLDADYIEKNREKILKDAEDLATRQVRVWYLIDAIAKAENIEGGEDGNVGKKVVEFVVANAKR